MADYHLRVVDDPDQIDPSAWDGLLLRQPNPTPFLRHAYVSALHRSGSAVPGTGWSPHYLTLWRGTDLAAAMPLYAKTHSYGEYVFDWAWADAYRRHGLDYYPKLLSAIPFTPVPGNRLLAQDAASRHALARALQHWAAASGMSSAHVLFMDPQDREAFESLGWLVREGVQFHWQADDAAPADTFETMVGRLQRHKRKNIAQERRRVRDAGVTFTVHEGAAIDTPLWDFFHRCYRQTYAEHHSTPYLTRAFFSDMAQRLPEHWVLFVAHRDGRPIACSLIAVNAATRTAWGRYWGSLEHIPCLHFEACYYQPLAWCIERGYRRFEGGAQGEHKMARGLLPVKTCSAHWLRDDRFRHAVADFLAREGAGIDAYVDELRERSPFKPGAGPANSPSPS